MGGSRFLGAARALHPAGRHRWPFLPAVLAAAVAALVAAVFGFPLMRLSESAAAIASFALLVIVHVSLPQEVLAFRDAFMLRAGIPEDQIGLFHQTIYNHTVGSGLVAAYSPWLTTRALRDEQRRIYAALDPEAFPSAAVAAPTIYPETEDAYLFSVDLLLDAIEARARAAAEATADLRLLERGSRG